MKSYKKKYQPGGEKSKIGIPVSHKDIQGTILPLDKTGIPYTNLPEFTITETPPNWLTYQREYERNIPFTKSEFGNNEFILRFAPEKIRGLMDLYNKRRDVYTGKKLLDIKHNIYGHDYDSRLKWFNMFSPMEQNILFNADLPEFRPAQRANAEYQSNLVKKYSLSELFGSPEKLSQSVSGTGERFRLFPNAKNNIESWINPLMIIGDMAAGLGNVPLNIKNKNYGYAVLGAATPVLAGTLGTLGTKNTGQWLKNTFLPLGGAEIDIPTYMYTKMKQSPHIKALNPFYIKNLRKQEEKLKAYQVSMKEKNPDIYRIYRDSYWQTLPQDTQESLREAALGSNAKQFARDIYFIKEEAKGLAARDMRNKYPIYYSTDEYRHNYRTNKYGLPILYNKRLSVLPFISEKAKSNYATQQYKRRLYINNPKTNINNGFVVLNGNLYNTGSKSNIPAIFVKTESINLPANESIMDLQTKEIFPFGANVNPQNLESYFPKPQKKDRFVYPEDISNQATQERNIIINKKYIETLQRNIDYILSLFPGSKHYGSSALASKVGMPHFAGDIDLKITQKDFEKIKDKFQKIKDIRYGYTYLIDPKAGKMGEVDLNIVRQNPVTGKAEGELALDMYRKIFPEKYYKLQEEAIKKSLKKRENIMPEIILDVTPEELLQNYNPEVMSVIDAYEAGVNPEKAKHINRIDVLINYGDPDIVLEGQLAFIKSALGKDGSLGKQFTLQQLSDVELNKKVLSDIDFIGDIEMVANDPKKMQIALNDFYINNSILTRHVDISYLGGEKDFNTLVDAYMTWKGKGGSGMGEGLNTVLFGDPSFVFGPNAIRGHKQFKLYSDNVADISEYIRNIKRKIDGSYQLESWEIDIINNLRKKYNIPITDIKTSSQLLDRPIMDDYQVPNYQKFLKEVGEQLDIKAIKRGEYGNSYYATDLGAFNPLDDNLNLMFNSSYRPLKSYRQRKERFSSVMFNEGNKKVDRLTKEEYYRIRNSFNEQIQEKVERRKTKFDYIDKLEIKRKELIEELRIKKSKEEQNLTQKYLQNKSTEITELENKIEEAVKEKTRIYEEIASLSQQIRSLSNEIYDLDELTDTYKLFGIGASIVGGLFTWAKFLEDDYDIDLYSFLRNYTLGKEKEFLDNVDINQTTWGNKNKEDILEKINIKYNSNFYKYLKENANKDKYYRRKIDYINWAVYNHPYIFTVAEYKKYLNDLEKMTIDYEKRKEKRKSN